MPEVETSRAGPLPHARAVLPDNASMPCSCFLLDHSLHSYGIHHSSKAAGPSAAPTSLLSAPVHAAAPAMPWELPQEVADRVQRARRLLAESAVHAGSADLEASRSYDRQCISATTVAFCPVAPGMCTSSTELAGFMLRCCSMRLHHTPSMQLFLHSNETCERLQSHWLSEDESPKQGLSTHEKRQVGAQCGGCWFSSTSAGYPACLASQLGCAWAGAASAYHARGSNSPLPISCQLQGLILYALHALTVLSSPVSVNPSPSCMAAVTSAVRFDYSHRG